MRKLPIFSIGLCALLALALIGSACTAYGESDQKVYWLTGYFAVPCDACGDIAFNIYDHNCCLVGSSTARLVGNTLTNIECDGVACITSGYLDCGEMCIGFRADGHLPEGCFGPRVRLEVEVPPGAFCLDVNTSCDDPPDLFCPYICNPGGVLTFTGGDICGTCDPSDTDMLTWSQVKALFR
jgi:hypothetical protein